MTRIAHTVEELQAACDSLQAMHLRRADHRSRAVVMTMGALHAGHAALMDAARHLTGPEGTVIVTIFVNPTQFRPGEDFERYPRTPEADVALCRAHDVDIVFMPSVDVVYDGTVPTIDPGPVGDILEGSHRPGHFAGVATVVHRLLTMTGAGIAVFGEKDYQQLEIIRRTVTEHDLPVTIVGVPTVRDADGVALSSRNRYLSDEDRVRAAAIPAALQAAAATADQGAAAAAVAAEATLAAHGMDIDYVEVTDVHLNPAPDRGEARLLLAVRLGGTRLIDNAPLLLGSGS